MKCEERFIIFGHEPGGFSHPKVSKADPQGNLLCIQTGLLHTLPYLQPISEAHIGDSLSFGIVTPRRKVLLEISQISDWLASQPESNELWGIAQGVWKFMGRSELSHRMRLKESLVNLRGHCWVKPRLPNCEIRKFEVLDKVEVGADGVRFHWKGEMAPTQATGLILNCPLRYLTPFASFIEREVYYSRTALYSITIKIAKENLPPSLPDTLLVLEDETLIDPDTEGFLYVFTPSSTTTEVEIFFSAPYQADLDILLSLSRQAVGKCFQLFPWSSKGLVSISESLEMESCGDDELRSQALRRFEERRIERYRSVMISPGRLKGLGSCWDRLPILNAHLPYPIGLKNLM